MIGYDKDLIEKIMYAYEKSTKCLSLAEFIAGELNKVDIVGKKLKTCNEELDNIKKIYNKSKKEIEEKIIYIQNSCPHYHTYHRYGAFAGEGYSYCDTCGMRWEH